MARVALSLLGPPRLERDGALVAIDTRKAVALLARLALRGAPESREAITALLWPDVDRTRGRAALRRTLSVLKKGVGQGILSIEGDTLAVATDADLAVDATEFHRALQRADETESDDPDALAHLARAVTLYRGDLLEGFGLRDSAPFDDWQAQEADALRRELAGALERLVAGRERLGDLEGALGYARRWLELDPLHEGGHRTVMRLLARAGRRSEALRQYRLCVRVLEQELGVAPLEETDDLYRAIMEGDLSPSAAAPPRSDRSDRHRQDRSTDPAGGDPDVVPTPYPSDGGPSDGGRSDRLAMPAPSPRVRPLVGRSGAWRALAAARERSRGVRFLLALEGEAGIGKSYLAEAFLDRVAEGGAATLRARCYPDEHHLPYGPLLDLLRSALTRPDATERLKGVEARWLSEASRLAPDLARLLPGLASPPPLDGPLGRNHLFEGIDRVLSALLAGSQPGVLLLDDAHWADPATVELLAYLARPERSPGVLLLLALRPERNDAHRRLRQLLVAGERERRADHLTLERWGREEVDELLRQRGAELDDAEAERLFAESEGLPFFVSEYLAARTRSGAWGELPQGVRHLLHSRLGAAGAMARQLLQTAAAIGRSFDFDLLRHASGRVEDEVVSGLEQLIALGLVREVDNGDGSIRFDFAHEKLRALVYDETSLVRRRLLHGRIADTLLTDGASTSGRPAIAGLIGSHLRLAGREAEAAPEFAWAGDHARSLFANEEALHHYRTALALRHPEPAALHEAIGDLHILAGAYERAITDFETAAAMADPAGVGRLEHKLGNVHQRRGAWEAAESHYCAAERLLDAADERGRAELLADRSLNAHRRELSTEALALAERALALAERSGDAATLARVHNLLGLLAHRRGDLAASVRDLERSLELTVDAVDPSARIAALNNLALVRAEVGDPDTGLALLEDALALCRRQGDRHREAALLTNRADLLHAGGRDNEAMALLKRAAALYAAIDEHQHERQPEIWKLVAW